MHYRMAAPPLLALCAAAGCQPRGANVGAAPPHEIDAIRNAWVQAVNRDDAAAIASLYAEQGTVLDPPEYTPVVGREAILKTLLAELPLVDHLKLRPQEQYASDDLAYDYGEFSERLTLAGGPPLSISGRYLLVLRRQEDGTWKVSKKIALMAPQQLGQSLDH